MVRRLINPITSNSFFVFGARGTGKTTFIKNHLKEKAIIFDLLDDETFDRLLVNSKVIEELSRSHKYEWIVVDEIQRIPKLLNLAHRMIEECGQKFALTGSSIRKIKRGGGNLMAGRAFVNTLFPFTYHELNEQFSLNEVLRWGSLPKIYELKTDQEKKAYLRSYILTYVKEEIQLEQTVRNLEPFREFLAVSSQSAGQVINYSNIARDVGVESPTVQNYFQILEDTYIGFILPQFHRSIRKSQIAAPKFYYFDNGVQRALEASLDSAPAEKSAQYGSLFESYLIQEIYRLNHYFEKDWRLSYYRTKHGAEVDLILTKGRATILIEIKSTTRADEKEVRALSRLADDFTGKPITYYVSRDPIDRTIDGVECIYWENFLNQFEKL